jgi:hypothetical protein
MPGITEDPQKAKYPEKVNPKVTLSSIIQGISYLYEAPGLRSMDRVVGELLQTPEQREQWTQVYLRKIIHPAFVRCIVEARKLGKREPGLGSWWR